MFGCYVFGGPPSHDTSSPLVFWKPRVLYPSHIMVPGLCCRRLHGRSWSIGAKAEQIGLGCPATSENHVGKPQDDLLGGGNSNIFGIFTPKLAEKKTI